jgi:hypothetical protein
MKRLLNDCVNWFLKLGLLSLYFVVPLIVAIALAVIVSLFTGKEPALFRHWGW